MDLNNDWYGDLETRESLGETTTVAGGLAGLHTARQLHYGQFWTPTLLVRRIWEALAPAFESAARIGLERINILDNSIGSGRMVQFANPSRDVIYGVDIDGDSLKVLGQRLGAAGFQHELLHAGLEQARIEGMHIALINPPYSIHLNSALLEPFSCNTHGRFGPATSAQSHLYALHQALDASQVVAAVLPLSAVAEVDADPIAKRLRAVYTLPALAFRAEGAEVQTVLMVFSAGAGAPAQRARVESLDQPLPPVAGLALSQAHRTHLRHVQADTSRPSVDLPVTGDDRVRITRSGKKLRLKFGCGFAQARVLNAIYGERLNHYDGVHRYPSSLRYTGEGKLDVEVILAQADPIASFEVLLGIIRGAGGLPDVDSGVVPFLRKRMRRLAIEKTPLQHTVFVPKGEVIRCRADQAARLNAKAKKRHLVDPSKWGSPLIESGQSVVFEQSPTDPLSYSATVKGVTFYRTLAELEAAFELSGAGLSQGEWVQLHAGRSAAFPDKRQQLLARARSLGIDQWLWGFQLDDVVELAMTRGGAVYGAEMGLGKTRTAVGLCLVGDGRHNLIVVQSRLVREFISGIRKLGLDESLYRVIDSPDDLKDLRRINLISYNRLRMPVDPARPKFLYAKALRNRIHTLIADEGDCISNDSQQVRALFCVSAKNRYAFSGTPVGNYPRNLHALGLFVGSDGTAAQPYGFRRPYIEAPLFLSTVEARRGMDVFRERFVTTSWVTHEFETDMQKGAKREVPVLSGLDQFREFAGKLVLRRVRQEPAVAAVIQIPEPEFQTVMVDFDDEHLSHYLAVVQDFAEYWVRARSEGGEDRRRYNLIAILARLNAVFEACNNPARDFGAIRSYTPITSKMRAALDLLVKNDAEGRQTLLFATSPDVCARLQSELRLRGVDSVLHTGKVDLVTRADDMDRFRDGKVRTMLCSFGVTEKGHNIPQATDEIFYNGVWSPRQKLQAIHRGLRPEQKNHLRVTDLQLRGSLDEYQARMVAMKVDAARAGLDAQRPEYDESDFEHWLSILDDLVKDVSSLRGVKRHDLRQALKSAA